jgi:hypothetical protein
MLDTEKIGQRRFKDLRVRHDCVFVSLNNGLVAKGCVFEADENDNWLETVLWDIAYSNIMRYYLNWRRGCLHVYYCREILKPRQSFDAESRASTSCRPTPAYIV